MVLDRTKSFAPINGIFDGERDSPSIFATPRSGFDYMVNITSDFDKPHLFDQVVYLLATASEEDTITFNINSAGGYVDTLVMLSAWFTQCRAEITNVLSSEASSCASAFFLLPCDRYIVADNATMFIHEMQSGASGTTSNNKRRIDHTVRQNEKFIRETYKDFLTEDEIEKALLGVEFFFDSQEIRDRLEARENKKIEEHKKSLQEVSEVEDEEFLSTLSDEDIDEEIKLLQAERRRRNKEKAKA